MWHLSRSLTSWCKIMQVGDKIDLATFPVQELHGMIVVLSENIRLAIELHDDISAEIRRKTTTRPGGAGV